jgi:hypothetical protein
MQLAPDPVAVTPTIKPKLLRSLITRSAVDHPAPRPKDSYCACPESVDWSTRTPAPIVLDSAIFFT